MPSQSTQLLANVTTIRHDGVLGLDGQRNKMIDPGTSIKFLELNDEGALSTFSISSPLREHTHKRLFYYTLSFSLYYLRPTLVGLGMRLVQMSPTL